MNNKYRDHTHTSGGEERLGQAIEVVLQAHEIKLVLVDFLLHLDPDLDRPAGFAGRFRRCDVRREVLQLAVSS